MKVRSARCRFVQYLSFFACSASVLACSDAESSSEPFAGGGDAGKTNAMGGTQTHGGQGGTGAASGSTFGGAAGAPAQGGAATGGSENPGGGGSDESGGRTSEGGTAGRGSGGGGGGSSGMSTSGEYGFAYRNPNATDFDWLCTFSQGETPAYVYAQSNQTGMTQVGFAEIPVYTTVLAQISMGGDVETLANARYDHGGGHNNDSLAFDYEGATYRYYHSSFGFGFRQCQPMDCLEIYTLGTTMLERGGCSSERTLPEVCVRIESDGTHAPLEDRFMKCAGDRT